ncbi:MAG: TetR/AcrR family transcriptional regulator [Beduini sp.]|uniref:TetR/AcrR family transcriptional regulator n=1 Tax=Beduini sp. TaxID=1922300 RepID=UPI00399FC77B
MTTKEKILKEALTLFSNKGYSAVYVGEIAEAVGIKAPSLYKHYKSKQDIFNAILEEMKKSYEQQTTQLKMEGSQPDQDIAVFSIVDEETLVKMGTELFLYFLHDEYVSKFRKMLTIEQFHDFELAALYSKQYVEGPLAYQSGLFYLLGLQNKLKDNDPNIMAIHFYSPIYLMLTLCDREPQKEKEALQIIEQHIRQFNHLYKKEGSE